MKLYLKLINIQVENKSYESKPKFIWDRRADLHQCSIRVGYFEDGSLLRSKSDDPLVVPKSEPVLLEGRRQTFNTSGLTMYGPTTQFFAILQSRLNFSVSWVYVDDQKWGAYDKETKDWNGIVGMVKRGQIDTSILDLSVTEDRSSVIKFTTPFRNFWYRLFMKKPGHLLSWNTFLNVFHVAYWCAIAASFTLCSIFIFSLSLHSNSVENNKNKSWMKILKFGEAFSTTARAFAALDVNQSSYACKQTFISSRVLTLVICTCGTLNFYIYNAGLISSLMVQKYDLQINELEDILVKPHYKLLVLGDSSAEGYLRSTYKQIWEKTVKENGIIAKPSEGERQIREDSEKVLFSASPLFEMEFDSYPCNVVASKIGYNFHSAAYVFKKDSQYIDLFNYHITSVKEKGLETEWFDSEKTMDECKDTVTNNFRAFSYSDVISAFVIFGLGCLIAVGYSTIECVYPWRRSAGNNACIERKETLQKHLIRLRNLNMTAKECLAQIENEFTRNLFDTNKEGNSEVDCLLCDVSHRYEKIISLLEQEISCNAQ